MPSGLLNSLWIVPILGILILVHELGHFVAARLVGIRVEEFGMGLPPRLWGYKARNGVLYSINWIPFGGFVRMYGQDDMRPDGGAAEGSDSFTAKTAPQRAFVLVAGVVMNLLLAILIFMGIAIGQGRPGPNSEVVILSVVADSPAAAAGWLPGDRIIAAAGQSLSSADTIRAITENYAGRAMPVTVERNGQQISTEVVPRANPPEGQGKTGHEPRHPGDLRAGAPLARTGRGGAERLGGGHLPDRCVAPALQRADQHERTGRADRDGATDQRDRAD